MRLRRTIQAALTACATLVASAGLVAAGTGPAEAATPLPSRVFAPYFESWTGQSPAALAAQSGAKHLTMAFLQTATKGSCTPYWNGDTGLPVASSSFGADITTIRANGGDVIPSFGGYTADNTGTELADSCTDVNQIAAAFENVITTYDISRIDLDIEDNSLTNTAGIDRRNKAIKLVQDWAAANGRSVQFSYTLPTTTSGLASSGLAVLKNAVGNNARIDVVNMMTFDYYDNAAHDMAADTQTSATGLYNQLAKLYPAKTPAQLWGSIGITEMVGIDDFGAAETFTVANATTVYNWAVSKGINTLSFWALQRDNGGCPGTGGRDDCSGISQGTWDFTHIFAPFTSSTPVGNDFSVAVNPNSGTVTAGSSTSTTVSTAVTAGSAQSVNLTVTGAPAGVTATVTPGSVTAGNTATLNITTTSATTPGTYPLTVTGSAASGTHTGTYNLTVTGVTPPGGLVNGGLETGGLAPWTCQSGGAVVSTPAHSGSYALQAAAGAGQTGQCSQTVTLQPNTSYTLSGWVQGSYAYLGVSGGATASTWTNASGWTRLSVPFTTGASGTVTVHLHGWYGQGNVYGDDFAIA
ncbi:glycosyl hydrolase family 18 protein [Streptomyces sp. CB01881]|uniref:glycosyl hydrolase family 18 protein n=1 Tax=Streptomyces sp. CB01881 TaxID=2078691 RepID=UPI000CDC9AF5|nr:glycosyl hydrolase family 18 protein [Streptomyces sp. CB01881]AUY49022.1 chitinase [Streptomyces sp. CB01881]TYC77512.1 chitinase [Streptomyces sp. CB01881]